MNRDSMQEELREQKEKRLKDMKKPSFIVILSCVIRLAFSLAFFQMTGFILSAILIVIGLYAVAKKHKCCLMGYGIGSLIQATVMYGLFIYFGIKFPDQPILFYVVNALYMIFITMGGFCALKLRRLILEYEPIYGPVPRCCNHRNNEHQAENRDDESNMTMISIPEPENPINDPHHQPSINAPVISIPQNMIPNVYEQISQPHHSSIFTQQQISPFQMMQMTPQHQFAAQQQFYIPQQQQYAPQQQQFYIPHGMPQVIPQQVFVPQNNIFYRI